MVTSSAKTVDGYLGELTPGRRQVVEAVREVILENLPGGYEEVMQHGMISYVIPLSRFPKTYNGQPLVYASLASQKNYISVYLMGVYASEDLSAWFTREWKATGRKLNMGKSCVRFKRIEDVALELVGEAVARISMDDFIKIYEDARG